MTSKEKVQSSLNHQYCDIIPIDLGSTAVSGIHVSIVEALRQYYGLENQPVKVSEPSQMLGDIEDDLAEVVGIDTIGISARKTFFGFINENWKEFKTPWGQIVLVSEHFKVTEKSSGDLVIYPCGDVTVPPSGIMPNNGYFFDTIIRQEPIDENNLNVKDNLEEFEFITDDDLNYFQNEIVRVKSSGKAVVANFGGTAIGDISHVPAPFLKHPKGIRDIQEWYMSTVLRQDYLHEIFAYQTDVALSNLNKIFNVVGNNVDVIFVCGTDFGTQTSQFCSVDTFKTLYAPYYKKMNDWIHKNTTWKTFKHSCGAVEPFMQHFIDSGFDIINPVQCSAAGMDPGMLKKKYGSQIVFWGGGVNTQQTLPFGTPEEVRAEVLGRCEIFSENGGFVFNSIHNVQANTPVENVVAMIDAVHEFNGK